MKTKTYEFRITIAGDGGTKEEAWRDATEHFAMDPGAAPEDKDCVVEEIEE